MPPTLETELVRITPAMAEQILAQNVELNRRLNNALVARYAADVVNGDWHEANAETIKIAPDGTLLDGQHRLSAVVESGRTVRFLVVRNVDPAALATVDTGKARSFADVLHMQGHQERTARGGRGQVCVARRARQHALLGARGLARPPRDDAAAAPGARGRGGGSARLPAVDPTRECARLRVRARERGTPTPRDAVARDGARGRGTQENRRGVAPA